MLEVNFLCFGKPKEKWLKEAFDEYLKRLSRFCKVHLDFLDEVYLNENPSSKEIEKALDEEGERVLKKIGPKDGLILIDLHGQKLDSIDFANKMTNLAQIRSRLFVVVGSSYGLSDNLRKRADFSLCLSSLTTIHHLALLLTMEQVYRSFKINSNQTYHK